MPARIPASAPRSALRIILETIGAFSAVYQAARERISDRPCPDLNTLADRDEAVWKARMADREIEILRHRIEGMNPHARPNYAPEDRFAILQFMRLAGLSVKEASQRFVLYPHTIRAWKRAVDSGHPERLLGRAPFNKLGDAARWLVHEIRSLCVEAEFGTRSIAMQLVRAGIQISRASVQRILREHKPKGPVGPAAVEVKPGPKVRAHDLLRPREPNRVWHLDLTTFELPAPWLPLFRYYVAALEDGFSRKLLALRIYRDTPTTADMLKLVRSCAKEFGRPRFLITDGGPQFRHRFRRGLKDIELIKGKDAKRFNGKVERFFRTLKGWRRWTLLPRTRTGIQRKLDVFRAWYNTERPMFVLGGRTPDEMFVGAKKPHAVPILAREEQPAVSVRRVHYGGDPHLIQPTLA
ncbi:MAG: DDE-type integrase/transposase/recombinase [Planctomycetota bacterium]|nr:DDE-type integrase/transposase/recombinase [Planctomycetota bacterium]